ncbi:MAG TPA: sulfotransferase [Gemmatimonadaceae bacterium]|nr:sulfotransferase [Gemmatimonadaceae bacterium]
MAGSRAQAPVFTVGSPRSGTTLLYHMLLSAGGFVRYRTETHVFSTLAPRFGGMRRRADIQGALDVWLGSDCHTLSALPADVVRDLVERDCRSPGDFLRLIMEEMGRRQGLRRWAETTPAHVLHMREIAAQLPGALFIHVVRDGRDVAASLSRQRWIRPLPTDRDRPALAAAAYWDWVVRAGRREGRALGDAYLEVRYEELVDRPQEVLDRVGAFIDQRLDHEEIVRVGIGSVGRPNTSFPGATGGFQGRWRTELAPGDARDVDAMLVRTLRAFGYESDSRNAPLRLAARARAYAARFAARRALKAFAPLARRSTSLDFFAPGSMRVTAEKLAQAVAGDAT